MTAPILPETMGAYSHTSEPVRFERDCSAVMVPSGEQHTLPAGAAGYITQALGGSFTVYVDGNLFRVRNEDADAIGKEPMPVPTLSEDAADADVEKLVWSQLRTCYDPEIPVNVVDLGLVYSCELGRTDDGRRRVAVQMTLTAPGCGMGPVLAQDVQNRLLNLEEIEEANVEIVWDPPWNQGLMTDAAKLQLGLM